MRGKRGEGGEMRGEIRGKSGHIPLVLLRTNGNSCRFLRGKEGKVRGREGKREEK